MTRSASENEETRRNIESLTSTGAVKLGRIGQWGWIFYASQALLARAGAFCKTVKYTPVFRRRIKGGMINWVPLGCAMMPQRLPRDETASDDPPKVVFGQQVMAEE